MFNLKHSNNKGFTLLELILVIALMAIISTLAASRVDSIIGWKQNRDVRKFITLWQFLNAEAIAKRQTYRLYLDLDKETYYVRREVPQERSNEIRQVDYLSNLRTRREKERRENEEKDDEKKKLSEEFEAEDQRRANSIEEQFYQFYFNDAGLTARLSVPLEFPSLGEEKELTEGLGFKDIEINGEEFDTGLAFIRFSSRGMSDFVVLHLVLNEEQEMTALMDPTSGKVALKDDRLDFDLEDFKIDDSGF